MPMLVDAFNAEVLKLRKRPAFWTLLAILLGAAVVLGYVLTYLVILPMAEGVEEMDGERMRAGLLPGAVVPSVLNHLVGFGGMLALILGVLAAGSEYGWSTLKTIAVQRPDRVTLMGGKLLAVGLAVAVFVGGTILVSWLSSLVIAAVEGAETWFPAVLGLLQGLAAGWLILATYAMLGVLLAVVLRGVGLSLGLGLLYVLVFEAILLALPLAPNIAEVLHQLLISSNALALSQGLGHDPTAMGGRAMGIGPGPAAAVLAGYIAAFSGGAILIFRTRAIE
jgi:ABC-2 type transport system permease protein